MSPEMVLAYIGASVVFVACAVIAIFLFAYALAIWDTRNESRES